MSTGGSERIANTGSMQIRVLLSGGPGAGKTTVLERLGQRGFSIVPEVARGIIAERKARGLSPRPPPEAFAREIVDKDIERYESSGSDADVLFFDRGLLDSLGMLTSLGLLSESERAEYLVRYPYHDTVFMFPPWQAIYRTDAERDQTFEEAVLVFESMCRWCDLCGYGCKTVPQGSVDERCDFILQSLPSRISALEK